MARPRKVSDARILEVARASFLAEGPAVSTVVIARRAGVSQAVLFKRFGSKDELMRAALCPAARPGWFALLEGGPDSRPLPEQLAEIGRSAAGWLDEVIPAMSVLRAAGLPGPFHDAGDEPPPVVARRLLEAWVRRATAAGRMAPVDSDAFALAFLGAIQARAFTRHMGRRRAGPPDASGSAPPPDDDAFVDRLVTTLWRGARPEPPRETP